MTSASQPPLDLGQIDRVIPSSVLAIAHKIVNRDLLLLGARVALGTIFFMSARTKVDGFLSIRDATYFLFEHEYALPLIPYEWAAVSGTYVEHLLSVLLIFGLGSRLSAFGILSMMAIVQVFVYPSAWPTHLSWAVLALLVVLHGGGRWSFDRFMGASPTPPSAT